ncbi:unnamed protein product [Lampetra planeri]
MKERNLKKPPSKQSPGTGIPSTKSWNDLEWREEMKLDASNHSRKPRRQEVAGRLNLLLTAVAQLSLQLDATGASRGAMESAG